MNYLKRKIDDYFSDKEKIDYNLLLEIFTKFMDLSNELVTILNELLLKLLKSLDGIEPTNRYTICIGLKEDKIRQHFTKISNKFKMIEDNYYSSKAFLPIHLKSYYDSLYSVYDDYQKLNELLEKTKSMQFSAYKSRDNYNKIKNVLNSAINATKGCKVDFKNLIKELNI